jgi:hypothetical protein
VEVEKLALGKGFEVDYRSSISREELLRKVEVRCARDPF